MRKPLITLAIMMVVIACGPEVGDENDIPGKLEYEQIYNRVYRQDHRIDVVKELPGENDERRECGFLTDRAYDDLAGTIEALDPRADYGDHPVDCETHGALIHIEGFERSPFDCSYECCHPDLRRAAIVYSVILNNFDGLAPPYDGEPYIAIEPDQPCP
ncbi:hypothetical protein [Paraliomyxa miuraensis]|uniref:hypothetical protein n=1 Tax=Paraliomyxa miuraensis TaxID=376150 RepID=UPI00225768E3|nr:hypothetical protein [Paraliomyxa miuraensis]MCX4244005.1 hypothetical protein [Paraliomyxa miuraensis]